MSKILFPDSGEGGWGIGYTQSAGWNTSFWQLSITDNDPMPFSSTDVFWQMVLHYSSKCECRRFLYESDVSELLVFLYDIVFVAF